MKQALFEKLEKILPGARIVASNTSGLRIARHDRKGARRALQEALPRDALLQPRSLHEAPRARRRARTRIRQTLRARRARSARTCSARGSSFGKDTPNFVGNRIGAHAMMATIHQMLEDGLAPEDVDNITGTPMAHPKSASFRTADLVGLDTFVHVADNCYASLTSDEEREVFKVPDVHPRDGREEAPRRQDQGRLLQARADKQIVTLDPKTLDVPRRRAATTGSRRRRRRSRRSRTRRSA